MSDQIPHMVPSPFGGISQPNNSPMRLDNVHSFEGVAEMTAVGPMFDPEYSGYTPQGPVNALASIRSQFPFLEIMQFPPMVQTVHLDANAAKDVTIPQGMAIARFSGDGAYFVCIEGNASIPASSAGAANPEGIDNASKSIFKPEWNFWYIQGRSSVSMIAQAACNVSISLWPINVLPVS